MSFLREQGATQQAPNYTGVQVQTSVNTLPVPVLWGTNKLAPNLIQYADYEAHGGANGGKGFGGKGSQTDYTATLILALCEGPISDIGSVWVNGNSETNCAQLGFTIFLGTVPQTPWGYMTTNHPADARPYPGIAYISAANHDLGSSPDIPNHNFEGKGAASFFSTWDFTTEDADMALVIQDFLTNSRYGIPNFPSDGIDTASLLSSADFDTTGDAAYQTWCRANGIAMSPALTDVERGLSVLQRWLQLTTTAVVQSGSALKFVPLADSPVTGWGAKFVPNTTPLYDLTDDDFLYQDGEEPVQWARSDVLDAYNVVRVECCDRPNEYAYLPIEQRDETAVAKNGLRIAPTITAHEITEVGIAQVVARLNLARGLYYRNTCTFKLGVEFSNLEPCDLVTVPEPVTGLPLVVRITDIEEDDQGAFTVTGEQWRGTPAPTAYPTQSSSSDSQNRATVPASVNAPIIFEPGPELVASPQVWAAVSADDPLWGGCEVWASGDGSSYSKIGTITGAARMGTLSATLPAPGGGNPDTASTLAVDLSESFGELISATDGDAAAGRTLCYVDGELVSFATATLTALYQYDLTYLYRGLYGSTAGAHANGSAFARLDDAVFKYDLPDAEIGQEIWLKFRSFNIWGLGYQDLASCTAYPYTPTGAGVAPVYRSLMNGDTAPSGVVVDQAGYPVLVNVAS